MFEKSTHERRNGQSLEVEATSFLLIIAGLFFLLESTIHYADFFVTSRGGGSSPVALSLTLGSFAIGLLYFLLAYSCLKNQKDVEPFAFATAYAGLMSISYFIVEIVESFGPKFYFSASFDYAQFLVGYGSVTILVELLIVFFSYRAWKTLSS